MGHHDPFAFVQIAGSLEERRAYPRFQVSLHGICSVAGGDDTSCSILDLSLGGARVACAAHAETGARLSLQIPHIGLLAARVARLSDEGTGVEFVGGAAERRRVRDYLIFVLEVREDRAVEDRAFERIVPLRRTVEVRRADARAHMARIKDVSRSGVALTTTVEMAVGEAILVGTTPAEVVRVFDGGFAARFRNQLAPTFDAAITL